MSHKANASYGVPNDNVPGAEIHRTMFMPQSYYHVLAVTSCYVAKRGTTWLRHSCNVRQRSPNVIKRGRT